MFKTSGRASFLIILFQFLQYYVFVVLSGDAFALFQWQFYCDSFTREEDCIQNLLCTKECLAIIGRLLCLVAQILLLIFLTAQNNGPRFHHL